MANKPFKKLRFSLTGDTYSPVDEQARQNIGDLSQLDTTHKSNLVEAINEAAQSGGSGTGVPSGGSKGQVLTKRSSVEGDAGWEYPPVMYASGNDASNLSVTWNENYTVMDFFMRQSIVQAEYEDSYVVHLKLIKAYITAVAPSFNSVYHFLFGAVSEIVNGTASFATLEVVCDNASAHTGVGVYTEVNVGVSDEAVQNAVDEYLTEHPALTGMFTNAAKSSLIALLEKVAYVDGNGQQYLDELITNLAATVTSISAVFTQGSAVVYDTDVLDTLRQYLVVTAMYSDGTSSIVSDYELSGRLTEGTSTITVIYGGQTDTFTVTVTAVIYHLENHTFSGGNSSSIPTGLTPLSTNIAFTLLVDVDFNDNTGFGENWRLFSIINSTSPYAGLNLQRANASHPNNAQLSWITAKNENISLDENFVGKVKLAIVHEANSNSISYQYKIGNSTKVASTLTSTYQAVTAQLIIGGKANGTCVFKGSVNSFVMYPTALSNDRVNAFMGA